MVSSDNIPTWVDLACGELPQWGGKAGHLEDGYGWSEVLQFHLRGRVWPSPGDKPVDPMVGGNHLYNGGHVHWVSFDECEFFTFPNTSGWWKPGPDAD